MCGGLERRERRAKISDAGEEEEAVYRRIYWTRVLSFVLLILAEHCIYVASYLYK